MADAQLVLGARVALGGGRAKVGGGLRGVARSAGSGKQREAGVDLSLGVTAIGRRPKPAQGLRRIGWQAGAIGIGEAQSILGPGVSLRGLHPDFVEGRLRLADQPLLAAVQHWPLETREFLAPVVSRGPSACEIREFQLIDREPHEERRAVGKWIAAKLPEHVRVAGEELGGDVGKEWRGFGPVGFDLQGRFKAGVARGNKRADSGGILGLIVEFIGAPGDTAVVGPFEFDRDPRRQHAGKKGVGIGTAEIPEKFLQRPARGVRKTFQRQSAVQREEIERKNEVQP